MQLLLLGTMVVNTKATAGEITVYSGYRSGEEFEDETSDLTVDLDESQSFGIILNLPHSKVTEMEFLYSIQSTRLSGPGSVEDGQDMDIEYWHLGGTYLFPRDNMTTYMVATFGATHFKPEDLSSETKFSLSLGGAAKMPLGKRFGLRLEGRAFMTSLDSGGAMFCNSGSCRVVAASSFFTQFEASVGLSLKF